MTLHTVLGILSDEALGHAGGRPLATIRNAFERAELAAIDLFAIDGPRTLQAMGSLRRHFAALLFRQITYSLANPRLEALRRLSVLLKNGKLAADREAESALQAGVTRSQLTSIAAHFAQSWSDGDPSEAGMHAHRDLDP